MSTPVKKSGLNLTKNNKIYIAVAALALCALVGVGAVTVLSNPADENQTGTPTDRPAATPTPVVTVPTEIHFSSNLTNPFYKGDTLRMTATLNTATSGITVSLLNKGTLVITGETDANGQVIFDRAPVNPFDYSVTATIP